MKDLCITWPKKRKLESYIEELRKASARNETINFRIPTFPKQKCERCYIVYDGQIVGWTTILHYVEYDSEEVRDPISGEFWPSGSYIVRTPYFHALDKPVPMKGFRGYRYIERPA